MYPELFDESGKWIFNSSAAEQANAWIVRFRPIVRDMLQHRFNFFLDEMILLRNETFVAKLSHLEKGPHRRRPHAHHAENEEKGDGEDDDVEGEHSSGLE